MSLFVKPGTEWESVYSRCRSVAPEAFGDGRLLNFWGGRWRPEGTPSELRSPIDGTVLTGPAPLEAVDAKRAARASLNEHRTWSFASLPERKARVLAALDDFAEHGELLALLLVWETGRTWQAARSDVDHCVEGVRWYAEHMLERCGPLRGPVGNIASWRHPMGVLMHAMLVQALTGNAAIANAPAEGGVNCLTLATSLAARHGVPVTLVSGGEAELSTSPMLGRMSYLDGQGVSCRGVWEFSDWPALAPRVRASLGQGRQRFVVQRSLFDEFVAVYLPAVRDVRFGHPLAVADAADPLPELDFGPMINDGKVKELHDTVEDAIGQGAVLLHRGSLDEGRFVPDQDTTAYFAPVAILNAPPASPLHQAEPFGPVDSVVLVDTEAELLAAMHSGNGSPSFACDEEPTAERLAAALRGPVHGPQRFDRQGVPAGVELPIQATAEVHLRTPAR